MSKFGKIVAAVAVAVAFATSCGNEGAEKDDPPSTQACREAMAQELKDSIARTDEQPNKEIRPNECDGLDESIVEKVGAEVVADVIGGEFEDAQEEAEDVPPPPPPPVP